jgi:hypothetical protein
MMRGVVELSLDRLLNSSFYFWGINVLLAQLWRESSIFKHVVIWGVLCVCVPGAFSNLEIMVLKVSMASSYRCAPRSATCFDRYPQVRWRVEFDGLCITKMSVEYETAIVIAPFARRAMHHPISFFPTSPYCSSQRWYQLGTVVFRNERCPWRCSPSMMAEC